MKWETMLGVGQAFAQGGSTQPQPAVWETLLMPLGIMIIMYFFILRPQMKRNNDRKTLIQNLKVGDEVMTHSGIIGKVKSIADAFVTLEIAPNTAVKFAKTAVESLTKAPPAPAPAKK